MLRQYSQVQPVPLVAVECPPRDDDFSAPERVREPRLFTEERPGDPRRVVGGLPGTKGGDEGTKGGEEGTKGRDEGTKQDEGKLLLVPLL